MHLVAQGAARIGANEQRASAVGLIGFATHESGVDSFRDELAGAGLGDAEGRGDR
jgi:hypothetical protein